mgnify:CR=1 FL=1
MLGKLKIFLFIALFSCQIISAQEKPVKKDSLRGYRSIEAYKKSFKDKADVLVLDPTSDFLKYMRSSKKKKD